MTSRLPLRSSEDGLYFRRQKETHHQQYPLVPQSFRYLIVSIPWLMDAKSQQISKAMRCKGCQSTRLNRNCVVVASLLVDVLLFIIRVI